MKERISTLSENEDGLANPNEVPKSNPTLSIRLVAFAICAVVLLGIFEAGARLEQKLREPNWEKVPVDVSTLDVYKIPDAKIPGLWRLRPGYKASIEELIEEKRKSGHTIGVELLERWISEYHLDPKSTAFEVNEQGFKGPALEASSSQHRILTIGDSCTFGAFIDSFSYPRSLERSLRDQGLKVEVVNGGVEGYSPHHSLARIEEYKALKPEITTVYIGWNALYGVPLWKEKEKSAALHLIWRAWNRLHPEGTEARTLDPHARDVDLASHMNFDFLADIEKIIKEMQRTGSRVAVITLPGLFASDEVPSEKALKIGHMPPFTGNPYVLAALAENLNRQLRELAQKTGAQVIDLAEWSKTELRPRDQNFSDSVHLEPKAQQKVGAFLAETLAAQIPK
jgi:lysophospholipase L1-like esterase